MPHHIPKSAYLILLIILIVGNILVYRNILAPQLFIVSVLEVAKGHAVLVRTPSGATLLIDTGPDAGILRALGTILPPWKRNIDAVILTSTKMSFAGGLPEVESRYRVSKRMHIGDIVAPYGTSLTFDGSHITIISPGTFIISYNATSLTVSSSTPKGVYTSDGQTFLFN